MATTCTDQPCDRPVRARGLCGTHYHYRRRHGTLPPFVRASGCDVPGCPRRHEAHGLCPTHRARLKKTGSLDDPIRSAPDDVRYRAKVDRSGGPDACWPWRGSIETTGYGRAWWDGRNEMAHRVAYLLAKGPIPAGLEIDHLCRNRPCQNPAHLEAVTQRVNKRRTMLTPELRARRAEAGRKGAIARWGLAVE